MMIEEHLADGGIRVTADDRHYRHPDTGAWHRSVTGIVGLYPAPQLLPWAVNSFNTHREQMEYLEEAGAQGSLVHNVLEVGGTVAYDERYRETWHYLEAARNFFKIFEPEIVRREFAVYGQVDGIRWAGTVDAEIMIDEGLLNAYLARRAIVNGSYGGVLSGKMIPALLDYKTSNNLYRKHYLQVAAYLLASSEDFAQHQGLILQLGTKHKCGFFLDRAVPIVDTSVFHHLCHIHKDLIPEDDPKTYLVEGSLELP